MTTKTRLAFPLLALVVACAGLVPGRAAAEDPAPLIGDIEGASFRAYPLAVPDFRTGRGAPDNVDTAAAALSSIVRRDLGLSGVFQVLDPRSFIDTDGVTLSTVKFDDWLNVGADGLVKAVVKPAAAGKISVEVYAFEVATGRQSFHQAFSGTLKGTRQVGHAISDALYRHFTGEPGVFSTKIVVVRKVGGSKQLHLMDADGEVITPLTKGGTLNILPSFGPDGRRVLFTSYRYDNPDLFEIEVATGAIRRVSAQPGLNTGGALSPDGESIALTLSKDGNSEVYLLDRSGGLKKRLTRSWGIDTSPNWSPDGRSIAFVSSRAGNPHIYLMDKDGANQRRLTFQGTYNQQPSFSPRGTHIAFTARDEFNRFDLFLYSLEDQKITRITQDQGNNEDPTFAPNGRLIAYVSDRSGQKEIWVTNLDGSHQQRLTATGSFSSPSWGPLPSTR